MPIRRLIRASLAAVALATLAGCNTTRFVEADPTIGKGPEAPVGAFWRYKLPLIPNQAFAATQTVSATFGEQRGVFQAAMDVKPEVMTLVITAAEGPRLVTITWDRTGLKEERTLFAPAAIKGENVLSDIFLSLWPMDVVRASMPAGVKVVEVGAIRRFSDEAGEVLLEIETKSRTPQNAVQEVRSVELGYTLKVTTGFEP